MRSSKCKHIYSKQVLVNYIKENSPQNAADPNVKCPTTGCDKQLYLSDLVEDKQMERRVQQHLRREQERGTTQQSTYQAIDEDDDEDEDED